jgi:hypothetical protein
MNFGTLLLGLLLTAIVYMAIPVIMLFRNDGKFDKKKAKKIALWNSIILGGIFLIITASTGSGAWSAGPALLYYWINSAILTGKEATYSSWKVLIKAINSNKRDEVTFQNEFTKDQNIYFHLEVIGKKAKTLTRILVDCTLPNGEIEMDAFDGEWQNGDRLVYSCDPEMFGEELGIFKCEFRDGDGNFLGEASVNIIE